MKLLLTIEGLKSYLGVTSSADDERYLQILSGVEEYMLGYTNIRMDETGGDLFEADEPIFLDTPDYSHDDILVEYVAAGTADESRDLLTLDPSHYIVLRDSEIKILNSGLALISYRHEYPVKVSLKEAATEYPESLALACYELTKHWDTGGFVQSKTQQGQSLAQFNTGTEMPPHILAIFSKHRIL